MSYKEHVKTIIQNKNTYIDILKKTGREGIDELIKFLDKSQFFIAPASARYHNALDGGLCDHSLKVHKLLCEKVRYHKLEDKYTEANIAIIALLHDICKVRNYDPQIRWRKDANNKWESYPGYTYAEQEYPLGHGDKSVIMAMSFIKLSKIEVQGIYWHMGLTTNNDANGFSSAAKQHPIVILTHTSDFEAAYMLETQGIQEELVYVNK